MLLQTGITSTGPVAPVDPALPAERLGDARQDAFQRSLQILLGKSVQGQVLSRLTDGSFLVKVAGTSARMMLPPGAQVGTDLAMTLVALDPRPTFQIAAGNSPDLAPALLYAEAGPAPEMDAPARAASLGAALLAKAPLTPAGLLPALDLAAPPPALSEAARAINTALTMAQSGPERPLALSGATPLMASPSVNPAQLAQTLSDALGNSGLFYESHVAEWADGKRTLAQLMREPQMQAGASGPDNDLAAAQLINLQLHTHELARVQWQGELWPGQKMEWDVEKEGPGQDDGSADAAPAQPLWRSTVRFSFPMLGEVTAALVLRGDQVQIRMQAASEPSATALRVHVAALEKSLDAAGAQLAALSISGQETGNGPHEN